MPDSVISWPSPIYPTSSMNTKLVVSLGAPGPQHLYHEIGGRRSALHHLEVEALCRQRQIPGSVAELKSKELSTTLEDKKTFRLSTCQQSIFLGHKMAGSFSGHAAQKNFATSASGNRTLRVDPPAGEEIRRLNTSVTGNDIPVRI